MVLRFDIPSMRLLTLWMGLFSFSWALSQDSGPLSKQEVKFLKATYSENAYSEELYLPVNDSSVSGFIKKGDRLFRVSQGGNASGYLLATRALGRYDYFDYLLAYAPDLTVLGLKVTTYRSSHGAAICQKNWLSQFTGYTGESLSLGKEIDAISGATISATSLVEDLKRTYQLMHNLKVAGLVEIQD